MGKKKKKLLLKKFVFEISLLHSIRCRVKKKKKILKLQKTQPPED